MSKVVGIDLGTTNSLVAYVKDGAPFVIRDKSGDGLVPSIVSAAPDGTIYVGREAQRRLLTDPRRTVYSVKRFMGKGIDDVQGDAKLLPFQVSGEPGGVVRIGLGDREFTPPEVSAFVLRELKRRAEEHFAEQGEFDNEVDRAVITVPAYFNDAQRTATRDAGRIAGLEVLRIINEPTAASLAYGLDKKNHGVIAVYDFGGGTFDISILRVEDGVFQVLSTNGDTHLGGDDIDLLIVERILADLASPTPQHALPEGFSAQHTPESIQEIRQAVIQAKWDLSELDDTDLLGVRLTRAAFEAMIRPVIDRTLAPCRQALADASLQASEVDEVVLVGGSTRIPLVRRLVGELFGRTPHSELNPDEVVAVGAAVQADILVTGNREMLLLDVTPLSLGIETMGGVMTAQIARNTTIPTRKSETFSTASDSQTSVEIHVLQGERSLARDNRTLGRFHLDGIPPAPRGVPQIEVTFDIDANGIVNVQAKDLGTGKEQKITITASSGLSKDEVDRMMREAESHADEDKKRKEEIENRNKADQAVYGAERFIKDSGDKLQAADKTAIEAAIESLKKAIESNDATAVAREMENLTQAQHKAAATLYQQAAPGGGQAPGGDGPGAGETGGASGGAASSGPQGDVIDAEVVDDK